MNLADAPIQTNSRRGLNEYLKDALLEACKEAARPLIRLCIKHGIPFPELATALRYVYVDSAKEDYLAETEGSAARIAVLSGIPRTEVEGIQDTEPESKAIAARMNASVQVLSAWHADPDFTGPYGIPLALPVDSPRGFDGLAERYGNGLPTDEILDDLIRAGCVAKGKGGTVKVLRRSYISGNIDPVSIGYAGRCLKTLAETLEFNIEKSDPRDKRFERQFISMFGIRESDLDGFNALLKEAGQKFLEDLDSWTTEREKALKNLERIPNEIPRIYPGVGLYMFFHHGPKKRKQQGHDQNTYTKK
jgi:hypothetical protein